jgi:hypothetical protein
MGARTVLEAVEKTKLFFLYRESNPNSSDAQAVA